MLRNLAARLSFDQWNQITFALLGGVASLIPLASHGEGVAGLVQPDRAPSTERAEGRVTHSSTMWQSEDKRLLASYMIRVEEEGRFLYLTETYFADRPTDALGLYLSPRAMYTRDDGVAEASDDNAIDNAAFVGLIEPEPGATQRFALPFSIDPRDHRSVLVYNKEDEELWGGAPLARGRVIAGGDRWLDGVKDAEGRYEVAVTEGAVTVRLGPEFRVEPGPQLEVLLSPLDARRANSRNAARTGLNLGPLRLPTGAQQVVSRGDIDTDRMRSLLIYSKEYDTLWAAAPLEIE